ncbi:MAG: hypothetical protein RIB58_06800 [Phycisphaerales bacterium]
MPWLAVLLVLLMGVQAADPVPPQRVDPTSMPDAPSSDPVLPRRGLPPAEQADRDEEASRAARATPLAAVASPPMRIREAPSIFTDEAYRHARVRSLLRRALEESVNGGSG